MRADGTEHYFQPAPGEFKPRRRPEFIVDSERCDKRWAVYNNASDAWEREKDERKQAVQREKDERKQTAREEKALQM